MPEKTTDQIDERSAIYSPDKEYRYILTRRWRVRGPLCMFVGLNPSTATAEEDDPTVRRCINFARSWSCAGLIMANAYGFRSTDPTVLRDLLDPVGPDNLKYLRQYARRASRVVVAWGANCTKEHEAAVLAVLRAGGPVYCLDKTKTGRPVHPLYQRRDLVSVEYAPESSQ